MEKIVKKLAFTLAEVLITIGVIGIIAALTMPNLITHYQKKAWVSGLQKTYSTVTNACENMLLEENAQNISNTDLFRALKSKSDDTNDIVKKYFKTVKTGSYLNDVEYKYRKTLGHGHTTHNYKLDDSFVVYLQDGTTLFLKADYNQLIFGVDINTEGNPPNTIGSDYYEIILQNNCVYNYYTGYKCTEIHLGAPSECFGNIVDNDWEITY